MAEIIGLIASIVALAETGFKISKAISAIATEFGTAGTQIRAIGTDTRAISLILREITKRIKRVRSVAVEVQNVAADIVGLCKSDIDDIEQFLKSLQPMQGSEVSLKQKTKWLFTKSKVSLRRASLDSLKLTLNLFVHTLEFIESGEIDEHIRDEVDDLLMERVYQIDEGVRTSERLRIESGEASNQTAGSENSAGASVSAEVDLYTKEDLGSDENKQLQLYDPQAHLSLMQNMSDDHFLLIAEHVRLQRLVNNFAIAVMDPTNGYLNVEEIQSTESVSPSSTMHRRFGVEEYLAPNSTSTGTLPGYPESNREHKSRNSNEFLSPDSQRPSSATSSRTPSPNLQVDGYSALKGRNEQERSFQDVDRVGEYSQSHDIDAESSRTKNEDRKTRDRIRFRFDIPSEDVWYPMTLAQDMKDMHENIQEAADQHGIRGLEWKMI